MSAAHKPVGRWTRPAIALQVFAVGLLATALAILAVWLAQRPALHVRFDATRDGRVSLSPELRELCARLPEQVTAEIFFNPLPAPYDIPAGIAQGEMKNLLAIAHNEFPTRFQVVDHDLGDVAAARDRMLALGVQEENVVVLRRGARQSVLRLFRDIADIDLRSPGPGQPPRPELARFKGADALFAALRQVLRERAPTVYFSRGHGERDPEGGAERDVAGLALMLAGEGFAVERWEPPVDGSLPADCDVLAIVAPETPFSAAALSSIRGFLAAGGRLFAVPGEGPLADSSGFVELLADFGLEVQPGFVCRPFRDRLGRAVAAGPDCLDMRIGPEGQLNANHPITSPLWRAAQAVRFVRSRALVARRERAPTGAALQPLATSPPASWIELPRPAPGGEEYAWSLESEAQSAQWLAAVAEFFPSAPLARAAPGAHGELARGRVCAVGSPTAVSSAPEVFAENKAFLLNAFHWLAAQEQLVTISREQLERPVVDVQAGAAVAWIQAVASLALPGLCLALGLATWWRRRR